MTSLWLILVAILGLFLVAIGVMVTDWAVREEIRIWRF